MKGQEKIEKEKRQKEVGAYLQNLRKVKNVSVKEVAKEIGFSGPYLYQVEYGKKALSDPTWFIKLAEYYGVPVDELLRKAGYLPGNKDQTADIESRFLDAIGDPQFSYGTRLKGKVNLDVKKFIVEMYERLKDNKKKG